MDYSPELAITVAALEIGLGDDLGDLEGLLLALGGDGGHLHHIPHRAAVLLIVSEELLGDTHPLAVQLVRHIPVHLQALGPSQDLKALQDWQIWAAGCL